MTHKKEAHYLLDSLADTVSRYNAFRKEANEAGMDEMKKEAMDLKNNIGELAKKVGNSDIYKRIAPTADAALKGLMNGAALGVVKGAVSDYKDPKDKKVHRLKNIWHDTWRGGIIGAATGVAKKEILDRKKPFIKSAHDQLDEMVKEAKKKETDSEYPFGNKLDRGYVAKGVAKAGAKGAALGAAFGATIGLPAIKYIDGNIPLPEAIGTIGIPGACFGAYKGLSAIKPLRDQRALSHLPKEKQQELANNLAEALNRYVQVTSQPYIDPKEGNEAHHDWMAASEAINNGVREGRAIIKANKKSVKTAHEALDEMLKEAMALGTIGTASGILSGIRKAAPLAKGAFTNARKALTSAGSIGKTMKVNGIGNTLMNAAKAVDYKSLGKAGGSILNRAMVGATVGGIADGVSGALKQQNNENNMYS